ncbi:MAG: MBL fold metallo-hydrolase [Spirochaetales bacterium]|nr:MBL fold metallo-hydrolase [Spirochaetales bacterium]
MEENLTLEQFTLGEWMTNCYYIGLKEEKRGWVFDAGFSPSPMIDFLKQEGILVEKLIFTHAHLDHIAGAKDILSIYPEAEILIHSDEMDFPVNPDLNLSTMAGRMVIGPEPDRGVKDQDLIGDKNLSCRVIHTPGHSPGGSCFYFEESGFLIAGDTLFQGSVGRYDFPTSDGESLFKAIREKLMILPDETIVYPGHGPSTTIGAERKSNAYL